jgi:hypothetical protein
MAQQITALPTPPSRRAPATFSARADDLLGALPGFVTEANALALEAEANANTAEASATMAAVSANTAQAYAQANQWVSGQTYAIGDSVWSAVDGAVYRRITDGGGTTDPSADQTNWVSALNLKTINGETVFGSGDIVIQGGTNLTYNSSTRTIASDTGTGAVLPRAASTTDGLIRCRLNGTTAYFTINGTTA